jgi:hypothetical protein
MTSERERNDNETQRGDSLPGPVCQQPDKNSPIGCSMQQLVGHQRKSIGSVKKTLALAMLEAAA